MSITPGYFHGKWKRLRVQSCSSLGKDFCLSREERGVTFWTAAGNKKDLERSVTLHYHGSTISGSEQSFLTKMAICIVRRWKKNMGYLFVLSAIMHRKSNMPIFGHICRTTVCWDSEMLLPWQHEVLSSPFYWAYPYNAVVRKPRHGMEKASCHKPLGKKETEMLYIS